MFRIIHKGIWFVLVFFSALQYSQAQPCLAGWAYRVPVIIDNSGNGDALTDFQVQVSLNTQALIVNGKAQLDGGDIRFLAKNGSVLPFWIENGTYNTDDTRFWVRIPLIPALQKDTIYLFYGEPGAVSLSSGDQTFDVFDDFTGATVNGEKWNVCNASAITVAGSKVTFTSGTLPAERAVLESKTTLNYPVLVEGWVDQVDQGQSFIGLRNETGEGYAMIYEYSQQPLVRMMNIINSSDCKDLDEVNPANNAARSANETEGIWKFTWLPGNHQKYSWPGAVAEDVWNDVQIIHSGNVSLTLGNVNNTGSFSLDWVRLRKYTETEPVVSVGSETASVVEASAGSNSPVCEGDVLQLSTGFIQGAVYSWAGPGSFSSDERQPEIAGALPLHSGNYILTVSIPEGCFSITDTVEVTVDATTVSGTAAGDDRKCYGTNQGTIDLSGNTGEIVRWESSPTGESPWNAVEETSSSLEYKDLLSTTWYRTVVKNGACPVQVSNTVEITIDEPALGGVITGYPEGCEGNNSGSVQLTGYRSEIMNWQYKKEGGNSWVDVTGTHYVYSYSNLNVSTWFRAKIRNGVCPQVYSDSVYVLINPLPELNFSADPVCFTQKTLINNQSSISEGSINSWYWEFSDGASSVSEDPVYSFDAPGIYQVKLKAVSDKGCISEDSVNVTVKALPEVDFSFHNVCFGFPAEFQPLVTPENDIVEYSWFFGEGNASSAQYAPVYNYQSDGKYNVKLIAKTSGNCLDSLTKQIIVFPRATLGFEADTVFLGELTLFQNTSSVGEGNLSYHWEFGDGESSFLANPSHEYQGPGEFTVRLTSLSSYGSCRDTLEQAYYVKDQTKASFTVENVCLYDSARFVNTSYIPQGEKSWLWDFGDGVTSALKNPVHLYKNPGTYTVKLMVETITGSKDEVFKNIMVYSLPVSRFVTGAVCDEDSAAFTNLSSIPSGSLTYVWDFGDGDTGTETEPFHLYPVQGDYRVTLVAISENQCKDTSSTMITVYPKPAPDFSVQDVCFEAPSYFIDQTTVSSGTIAEYLWTFGDGTNSVEKDPVKLYALPGAYDVLLKVISDKGCEESFSKTTNVIDNPVAAFSAENECFGTRIQFIDQSDLKGSQLKYFWDFGDSTGTSDLPDPAYLYSLPGTYPVTLTIENNYAEKCRDSITLPVTVYALPTIQASGDTSISKGLSAPLKAEGGLHYSWQPSQSLDFQSVAEPIATPYETTVYTVTGTDGNGCTGTDQVTITVENNFLLFPSNVLTPDGNGKNDTWYVGNIEAFPEARIVVVDRWGKKVYETSGYLNDWEGVGGTDILPEGDYYYLITSPDTDKVYSGTITIIRTR